MSFLLTLRGEQHYTNKHADKFVCITRICLRPGYGTRSFKNVSMHCHFAKHSRLKMVIPTNAVKCTVLLAFLVCGVSSIFTSSFFTLRNGSNNPFRMFPSVTDRDTRDDSSKKDGSLIDANDTALKGTESLFIIAVHKTAVPKLQKGYVALDPASIICPCKFAALCQGFLMDMLIRVYTRMRVYACPDISMCACACMPMHMFVCFYLCVLIRVILPCLYGCRPVQHFSSRTTEVSFRNSTHIVGS